MQNRIYMHLYTELFDIMQRYLEKWHGIAFSIFKGLFNWLLQTLLVYLAIVVEWDLKKAKQITIEETARFFGFIYSLSLPGLKSYFLPFI